MTDGQPGDLGLVLCELATGIVIHGDSRLLTYSSVFRSLAGQDGIRNESGVRSTLVITLLLEQGPQ